MLQFGGDLSWDEIFMNLVSLPSAGRRWPVVAPGESIGVDVRRNGTWEAHVWLKDHNIKRSAKPKNGHQFFMGSFDTKDEAKCAHDQTAIMLDVRVTKNDTLYSLNHLQERYVVHIAEHAGWSRRDYMWKMWRYSGKFSKGAYPSRALSSARRVCTRPQPASPP